MAQECPVLQSSLSIYLKSNQAPSDEDAIKVMELRQKPSKTLARIDALIHETRKALNALEEERDCLQQSISRCNAILSSIRKVPEDVWREIFIHSIPLNPTMSYTEAPLLLTHVCSSWKSIALSTPQIWSRIYIPIVWSTHDPIFDLPPTHVDHPEIFGLSDKIQLRCDLVREWLERTRALPLTIALRTESGQPPKKVHHQLLDIIFHHSNRFKSLDLATVIMGDAYNRAMKIPVEQLSMLEELRITSVRINTKDWYKRGIFTAPRLRKVSITSLPDVCISHSFKFPSNWAGLVSLCIGTTMENSIARDLLIHCSLLVHCNLTIRDPHFQTVEVDKDIILPHLTDFVIAEDGNSGSLLYRAMHAPRLGSLECYASQTSKVPTKLHILNLLPRLDCLRKLVIHPRVLTKQEALKCFRLMPSLTHLCLGTKNDGYLSSQTTQKDFHRVMELLLSTYPSEANPKDEILLLPQLEILEIHYMSISDKCLLDFIITRSLPRLSNTPSLKNVTGYFSRVKQMDISRQVEHHAKTVGIDFRLDLHYYATDLEQKLSPTYGSTNHETTLWI